ncbi:iron-sulfur cluster assembly scaffold protein [Pararhodobacter marinus]|uniref:Iron-sulfur cluster assembly scaffold protein n=1 Tax=Pararhodobacter marinus TaxID=2184063 RepID=A0A2U2CBP6_9RHOB|nr:iron-sulfur cluster assembly scaffold protein [Pararhodobacter marinus]PWE29204.1 iron-sulfur cluster assembly scaffold protein [Pararhodobacter marinus]
MVYILCSTGAHEVSESSDLIKLYSNRILGLAAEIPHLGRLDSPQASVKKRSPLCGSTVTVDLDMTDGRVSRFAQEVKACALGQASAAVLGDAVMGRSAEELQAAARDLEAMLKKDGPVPAAPFDGYEALIPAREFKNRHASILLSVQAAAEAAEAARAS